MKRRAFLRGLGAAGGLAFAPGLGAAAPAARGRAVDCLRDAKIQIGSRIRMIARGPVQDDVDVELGAGRSARRADHGATLTLTATPVAGKPDAVDLLSTFKADTASRRTVQRHPRLQCLVARQLRGAAGLLLRGQSLPVAAPRLSPPAHRAGRHRSPCSSDRPGHSPAQRGAGNLVVRRRHGRAWRRPRSAFMCRRSTSASSCSSDRPRRAAAGRLR